MIVRASSLIIFFICLFGQNHLAAQDLFSIASLELYNAPQVFRHQVDYVFPGAIGRVDRIRYQVRGMGDFVLSNFEIKNQQLLFQFFPPSYQSPINFILEKKDADHRWHQVAQFSRNFNAPQLQLLKDIKVRLESGSFSSNFFLVNGILKRDAENSFYFPMIINKFGEIVWAYFPLNNPNLQKDQFYIISKKVGANLYAILNMHRDSFFQSVDSTGKVIDRYNPKNHHPPFSWHRDFLYWPESKKLMTFTPIKSSLRDLSLFRTGFSSWSEFRNGVLKLLGKPLSYLFCGISEIDLKKKKRYDRWNPLAFFSPYTTQEDNSSKVFTRSKLYFESVPFERYLKLVKNPRQDFLWDKNVAHIDWIHANSLQHYPGVGYLVSFKLLSRVALISEDFSSIKWTLGKSNDNDYVFDEGFAQQHHVSLTPEGTVLLIDNQGIDGVNGPSRLLELELKEGKAYKRYEFIPPGNLFSYRRGSVFQLANKNLVAYFPDLPYDQRASLDRREYIFEVNPKNEPSDQIQAVMRINFNANGNGNQAQPFDEIGEEIFLGANH